MKITQEGDYALRVVLYLSNKGVGEIVEAKVIAGEVVIPLRFLLKLLRKLTVAGILHSHRGVGGGYALARDPADITLFDVIDAIDGPLYINRCLYDKAYCTLNRTETCAVHGALEKIQVRLLSELKGVTFKDMMDGAH
ncbi:transcriptional regulator, BadM/Rrf2 family [Sporobacter termitidis DSM 10068]|uniref:Transcriptional regulator, BadM/Rrf2 family n=1 Tax=Sporobacter termitidis DSM 10068 TaxID=1123282 RepID=A0A1M5XGP7_9FIRM|nr:Rrf2 family transcriptional regulator [Sporobacter termitidis]SHH98698.1 transcriptional regulator, BadM/Rrf2 family [Sporobacter termitidis DSM 10068]